MKCAEQASAEVLSGLCKNVTVAHSNSGSEKYLTECTLGHFNILVVVLDGLACNVPEYLCDNKWALMFAGGPTSNKCIFFASR